MTLNLTVPQQAHTDFTPRITVIGVGGGGTNAVDNMIAMNLQGVEFVVANTDAQQLVHSRANRRIQLGLHITQGLGAGAKPDVGRMAAEEAAEELYHHLDGAHMVFITAGMGGGTGTGAAPVIARMARERNILTVGVVTKPFTFEGSRRARAADQGIEDLQQYVDTLIVIPNQNLFRLANDRTGWKEAFKMADNVLYMGVRGVTDLMMAPGLVNLDFADIRTVMAEMGKAMMGTGEAEGEGRAVRAAEFAISNPLLEDTSMAGARGLLINITGGEDMTLFEVDAAANRIREEVDEEANIIFGSAIDESLAGKVRVSVVATGIDTPSARSAERPKLVAVGNGAPVQAHGQPTPPMPGEAVRPPAGGQMGGQMGGQAAGQPMGDAGQQRMAPVGGAAANPLRPSSPVPPVQQGGMSSASRPVVGGRAVLPQPPMQPPVQPQPYALTSQRGRSQAAAFDLQSLEADAGHAGYETVALAPDPAPQPRPAAANPGYGQTAAQSPRPPVAQQGVGRAPRNGDPRAAVRGENGLFNPPPAQEPAPAPVQPASKTLFSLVTGAIRGAHHAPAQPPAPAPAQRSEQVYIEPRPDPARGNPRPAGLDESQVDIPAFLRRQS